MGDAWAWRPELGRWRLDQHGYPDKPTFASISTNGVPPSSAYDYWRDVAFSDFEPDRLPPDEADGFKARARGLIWRRGDFFESESAAVSGSRQRAHYDRDGLDSISVGLVTRGRRWAEQEDGSRQTAGPGELFVYDGTRVGTVRWTAHNASFVTVRREDAQRVLGNDIPSPAELAHRLAASPMRHLVADQFRRIEQHYEALSVEEQMFLLEQTIQLTLFTLARRSESGQPMTEDKALFHTALRFISTNLADPLLDAQKIADGLRVSRATLYRAFSGQQVGVAEVIRDLRLDRAHYLLEHAHPALGIAEIALRCGIYDTPNFSRLFKRRFGVPPSQIRNSRK